VHYHLDDRCWDSTGKIAVAFHFQTGLRVSEPRLGKVGTWSWVMWRQLEKQIELTTGVRFRWKDMRPTFAQEAKDAGSPIEVVSKALRHTDTRTTEEYYARIRRETAFSQLR